MRAEAVTIAYIVCPCLAVVITGRPVQLVGIRGGGIRWAAYPAPLAGGIQTAVRYACVLDQTTFHHWVRACSVAITTVGGAVVVVIGTSGPKRRVGVFLGRLNGNAGLAVVFRVWRVDLNTFVLDVAPTGIQRVGAFSRRTDVPCASFSVIDARGSCEIGVGKPGHRRNTRSAVLGSWLFRSILNAIAVDTATVNDGVVADTGLACIGRAFESIAKALGSIVLV